MCSPEVGSASLFSMALALLREEGMGDERFHPSAQKTSQLPDWREEGSMGLPS